METKPETMKEQIKTPKAFVERQTEMQEESTLGIQHLLESIHIHAKYLSILFAFKQWFFLSSLLGLVFSMFFSHM